MSILWGYQWVVYQLATSHETLAKNNNFHSLKHCDLWNGIFKTKCYQEPLASFIEVGQTLDALMRVSLCRIKVEKMDGRTIFVLFYNIKNRRVLSLDWNTVRSSKFSTFIFERTWFDLHFCTKDSNFLNPSLKNNLWCCPSHWKAKKKRKSSPSNTTTGGGSFGHVRAI